MSNIKKLDEFFEMVTLVQTKKLGRKVPIIAVGRDYWDVAPVRGIRERGGVESMNSIVQVLAC